MFYLQYHIDFKTVDILAEKAVKKVAEDVFKFVNNVTNTIAASFDEVLEKLGVKDLGRAAMKLYNFVSDQIVNSTLFRNINDFVQNTIVENVNACIKNIKIIGKVLANKAIDKVKRYQAIIVATMNEYIFNEQNMARWNECKDFAVKNFNAAKKYVVEVADDIKNFTDKAGEILSNILPEIEKVLDERFMDEEFDESNKLTYDLSELSNELTTTIATNLTESISRPLLQLKLDDMSKLGTDEILNELDQMGGTKKGQLNFLHDKKQKNRSLKEYKKKDEAFKPIVQDNINDFESGGMPGSEHMEYIAEAVFRTIKLLNEKEELMEIYGVENSELTVEVQHHKPSRKYKNGVFTIPGYDDPPPPDMDTDVEKDSLFNVLAKLTGNNDPHSIREEALIRMKDNFDYHCIKVKDLDRLNRLMPKAQSRTENNKIEEKSIEEECEELEKSFSHNSLRLGIN